MQLSSKPNYGIDAPNLMRSMLAASMAIFAVGILLRIFASKVRQLRILSPIFLFIGLIPSGLGLTMAAYALRGKYQYRDVVLQKVTWRGDEQVLDVGTGRGLMMNGAAKHLTTGKVIGIDIWRAEDLSGNSPENALHNARLEGVEDHITVMSGDVRAMQFADNTFDIVLSTYCLNNIEDKNERLAACYEIARVLKSRGTALISDYTNAREYARSLRQAGLIVTKPKQYFLEAYGPMWLVEAKKP